MFHSRSHPKTLAPSSARALASSTPLLAIERWLQTEDWAIPVLNPTCQRTLGRCMGSSQLWWSPPSSCSKREVGCYSTLCWSQSWLHPLWSLRSKLVMFVSQRLRTCFLEGDGCWIYTALTKPGNVRIEPNIGIPDNLQYQSKCLNTPGNVSDITINWIVSTWESRWWCCVPYGHRSGLQRRAPRSPSAPRIPCSEPLQQGRQGGGCPSW